MSAPKEQGARGREQGARKKAWVGGVARRPAAEVLEEMEVLACEDRRKLATTIPPAPRPPARFYVTRGPPLPTPEKINPYVPASPDRARIARAAAISARAHLESEAYLLAKADAAAAVPRETSPPRAEDDFYDLAKWVRRRWR